MCKKLLYLVSFVVLLGLAVGTANADITTGLLGHWKLDGDATDSSGNGYDGILFGNPKWEAGYYGDALELDGEDDRVEIPDANAAAGFAHEGEITWAAWVKTIESGRRAIICQGPAGAAHVNGNKTLGIEPAGTITVRANGVGAAAGFTSSVVVTDGQWHHVAVTFAFETSGASDTIKVYIDGDLSKGYETETVNINQNRANATDFIMILGNNIGGVWVPYNGLMDDVRMFSRALTEEDIQQVMEGKEDAPPAFASGPSPADEATDVPRDVTLSWRAGIYADKHDVYLGTNLNNVSDADRANPLDVLVSQNWDSDSYSPAELLQFGQTYYWRVDEVNAPPDNTIFKGDVWSFTAEPFAYPLTSENITATASSSNALNEGPENTINSSGLDDNDLHSVGNNDMWLSSMTGPQPTWIQYELDRVYKLHEMLIWNHNSNVELVVGFGIKDAIIEYSVDEVNWTTLGTTHEFARGSSNAGYAHNTTVDLSGVIAKYIKITANSNWGGIIPQFGLSEVRFFYIPIRAREPYPDSGATDVDVDVTISFRAGREAAQHDMYLSTDEQAVIDSNVPLITLPETSYGPLSLDLAQTYYWKVNEVNIAETPTTLEGDVWNFATREFLVVDDFESYNDLDPGDLESNRIFLTWIDGFEQPTNGSIVGYPAAPFAEQDIVHSGGQSMPLFYDNSGTARYSEAELTLSLAQDWTKHGINALSLWFSGDPNNVPDQMYVKINGSKVAYDSDAGNLTLRPWQPWNIDLASLGIDVQNVTKFSIGFGDEASMTPGGSGIMFFDDIRLYPYSRQLITPAEPDAVNLVAQYEFEGTANDSSGNGLHGTVMGNPTFVAGKVGQAISLRGLNDFVEITGYKGILGPNAVTVTAWINTTTTGTGTIVGWGPNASGERFGFRVNADRLRIEHAGGNVQGDTRVNDSGWHHVAVMVQASATISYPDVILYVDGIDDTRASTDPDVFNLTADQDVRIGSRPASNDRFFMGLLDDVRIYDRALTAEEIAWLAGRTEPFDKPF